MPPTRRCFRSDPVPMIPVPPPEKPLATDILFRMIVHTTWQDHQVGSWLGVSSKSALATLFYTLKSGLYTACAGLVIARCPAPEEDDEFEFGCSTPSSKIRPRSRQTVVLPISNQLWRSARSRQQASMRPYTCQRLLTSPEFPE